MNPLLLTITFLTILALLTSSEAARTIDASCQQSAFESYNELASSCEEKLAEAQFEALKLQSVETHSEPRQRVEGALRYSGKSAPLKYDHGRPPDNSRLNLFLLMNEGKESALYEKAALLMRHLYGDQPFFQEVVNLEYRILDALIQLKDMASDFFFVDELATLPFNDKEVHRRFLMMLKGTPPFLHFITYNNSHGNQQKLNLMFAPTEILEVMIPDFDLFQKIVLFRNQLWEQIDYQEANRKELSKEQVKSRTFFKEELVHYLNSLDPNLAKQFDVTLGKKGSVIFVQDPASRIVKRERIMKKGF